jgi:hypothetical protein
MSLATSGKPEEGTLKVLSPDLPMLASQAAIELDNLILKKGSGLKAVKQLARLLTNSFGTSEEPVSQRAVPEPSTGAHEEPVVRRAVPDPSTVAVMSRAFDTPGWGRPVKTVSDLVEEAWGVASGLENAGSQINNKGEIARFRAFCAQLALSSARYLQSVAESRPAHPFRR